ncbi:hypothetical protein KP509_01G102900 [Ceratopteris richardii]|uniref:UspA domain-containing protein n=1 Tax=Ceratopteris richardii TaxID=49495 RepID=A0A8T2VJ45_CERRI|nr:hypothetical protein KP509_01G102900 [Ceratopteris richardii]
MATTRKLVVAVDETESSQVAFLWVLHNLARHSDHIVIFNAAPYVGSQFSDADIANEYLLPSLASEQVAEAAEKEVTERSMSIVNRCLAKCQELGFSCEGEVVKGEPGSWIIDESERLDADVVVVGCREAGLITRTLFGSVGENVLHNALCPVVIVRPAEKLQDSLVTERSRNIVIAVDDSKEAAGAFVWALQNFCRVTDKVTIYHVHKSSVPSITSSVTGEFGIEDVYLTPDTTDEMEVKALTDSEKLVEKFMSYVSDESKISCQGMVVTGQTEEMICKGLVGLEADAVVLGTHEKGVVARTFLGSVSDYLAHESPCPVIVVKQKKDSAAKSSSHKHTS